MFLKNLFVLLEQFAKTFTDKQRIRILPEIKSSTTPSALCNHTYHNLLKHFTGSNELYQIRVPDAMQISFSQFLLGATILAVAASHEISTYVETAGAYATHVITVTTHHIHQCNCSKDPMALPSLGSSHDSQMSAHARRAFPTTENRQIMSILSVVSHMKKSPQDIHTAAPEPTSTSHALETWRPSVGLVAGILIASVAGFIVLFALVSTIVNVTQHAAKRRWDIEEGKRRRSETEERVQKAVTTYLGEPASHRFR
jgi:hypothetical protein